MRTSLLTAITGHAHEIAVLENSKAADKVPHALLFSGPSGIGKKRVAFAFAAELLAARDNLDTKRVQRGVSAGNYPDLHVPHAGENLRDISVESIRTLCQEMQLKPYYAYTKVAIIDNAHRMSLAASNALLKTLEEPPGKAHFFLTSNVAHRLPETIVSRCQVVHFSTLAQDELRHIIRELLLSVSANDALLQSLVDICDGSLEPLGLAPFFEARCIHPMDPEKLRAHLEHLHETISVLNNALHDFRRTAKSPAEATKLSSRFIVARPELPLSFSVLRRYIREQMRTAASGAQSARAAALLTTLLESERLVSERNANPDLHIVSALIRLAKHREERA